MRNSTRRPLKLNAGTTFPKPSTSIETQRRSGLPNRSSPIFDAVETLDSILRKELEELRVKANSLIRTAEAGLDGIMDRHRYDSVSDRISNAEKGLEEGDLIIVVRELIATGKDIGYLMGLASAMSRAKPRPTISRHAAQIGSKGGKVIGVRNQSIRKELVQAIIDVAPRDGFWSYNQFETKVLEVFRTKKSGLGKTPYQVRMMMKEPEIAALLKWRRKKMRAQVE